MTDKLSVDQIKRLRPESIFKPNAFIQVAAWALRDLCDKALPTARAEEDKLPYDPDEAAKVIAERSAKVFRDALEEPDTARREEAAPELPEGEVEGLIKRAKNRARLQTYYSGQPEESYLEWKFAAALARQKAEIAAYRKAYGCIACGEDHPEGTMCPPFEVRTTGMSWNRGRLSNAVARAERAEATADALKRAVEAFTAKNYREWFPAGERIEVPAHEIHSLVEALTAAKGEGEGRTSEVTADEMMDCYQGGKVDWPATPSSEGHSAGEGDGEVEWLAKIIADGLGIDWDETEYRDDSGIDRRDFYDAARAVVRAKQGA